MARVPPLPASGAASGERRPFGATFRRRAMRLMALLLDAVERSRQRRALLYLDDRLLSDIGLSRSDVESETRKPFWHP